MLYFSVHLVRNWVCGVINYKLFSNSVFITWTRYLQHILQILVTFFRAQTVQKTCRVFLNSWCTSFEYHCLSFTFVFTLPPYLVKKCICFEACLGKCQTGVPFLSLHPIACLSCTREDGLSSLLPFKISPSLQVAKSLEKCVTHECKIRFQMFL